MGNFVTFLFAGALAFTQSSRATEVKRISSIYKDLSSSQKVYLHGGLISVMEFPQNIIEVRVGNPQSIKVQISQVSPKELTLFLQKQAVEPTNIIVKSEKRFYVFDIIPSKVSHQDFIKVSGAYGSPSFSGSQSLKESRALVPKVIPKGKLLETLKVGVE